MQLVARANLIFGLHVHVGVEDRETAIHLMNHARYFLPHILALSTNSPFWLGMNTGLKSYRCKVFDKFPRTNIPDYFPSWGEYDNFIKLLIKTNCIDNAKKIWWDIRPHPFFNTLEFRVCDIPRPRNWRSSISMKSVGRHRERRHRNNSTNGKYSFSIPASLLSPPNRGNSMPNRVSNGLRHL